jgi:hypothetical protein
VEERKEYKQSKIKRSESFQKLHDLTKKGREYNRIPLVSSTQWDVIRVLSVALLELKDEGDTTGDNKKDKPEINQDRRLICWTLNNLSIPYENKAIMAGGDASSLLFRALTAVIRENLPSSYLCIICLMNLTFLAEAIEPVAYYVIPTACECKALKESAAAAQCSKVIDNVSQKNLHLLENTESLLRSLERLMLTNSPFLSNTVTSVQGEAIRWACGLIRNITFAQNVDGTSHSESIDALSGSTGRQGSIDDSVIEEICTVVSQTEIPRLVVTYVRDSPNPTLKWTKDSLEDICLGVVCQLAQWSSSREALIRAGAIQSLEKVEG